MPTCPNCHTESDEEVGARCPNCRDALLVPMEFTRSSSGEALSETPESFEGVVNHLAKSQEAREASPSPERPLEFDPNDQKGAARELKTDLEHRKIAIGTVVAVFVVTMSYLFVGSPERSGAEAEPGPEPNAATSAPAEEVKVAVQFARISVLRGVQRAKNESEQSKGSNSDSARKPESVSDELPPPEQKNKKYPSLPEDPSEPINEGLEMPGDQEADKSATESETRRRKRKDKSRRRQNGGPREPNTPQKPSMP